MSYKDQQVSVQRNPTQLNVAERTHCALNCHQNGEGDHE